MLAFKGVKRDANVWEREKSIAWDETGKFFNWRDFPFTKSEHSG